MISGGTQRLVLLVALCPMLFSNPCTSQVINLMFYPHNVSHPNLISNSLKMTAQLVADLELEVPAEFENVVLGNRYAFVERNLLAKALLHRNYKAKSRGQRQDSFEPLDAIGNMVLEYMITRTLIMNSRVNLGGEVLNKMRNALLYRDAIAFIAVKNKLDDYIFIDDKHVANESHLARFKAQIKDEDNYQLFVSLKLTNLELRQPSGPFLFRIMKALIGAVHVDTGYDIQKTEDVIMPMFKKEMKFIFNNPPK